MEETFIETLKDIKILLDGNERSPAKASMSYPTLQRLVNAMIKEFGND